MDIEKIQKQVVDLKTNVSLLEQSYANDFNSAGSIIRGCKPSKTSVISCNDLIKSELKSFA